MPAVRGSHRWIPLPFFQVQTSEFGKLLLIAALAAFAVDRSRRLHERRTTARIMLLALLPAMIVIPQPDLGTGLVYVAVAFAVLFFAGTSWKQLTALVAIFAAAVAIVLGAAPAAGVHVLKPYQVQRLTGFLNPSRDPAIRPTTSASRLSQSVLEARPEGVWREPLRPEGIFSRRTRRTSSSRSSGRPTGSPAPRSCYRYMHY